MNQINRPAFVSYKAPKLTSDFPSHSEPGRETACLRLVDDTYTELRRVQIHCKPKTNHAEEQRIR